MTEFTIDTSFWFCIQRGHCESNTLIDYIYENEESCIALDKAGAMYDEYESRGILNNTELAAIFLELDEMKRIDRSYNTHFKPTIDRLRKLPIGQRPNEIDRVVVCVSSQTKSLIIASNDTHITQCPFVLNELNLIEPWNCIGGFQI